MPTPRRIAKLTSKNQLTLPAEVIAALGHPTHFQVQVAQGALVLFPARLVREETLNARPAKPSMVPGTE